MTFFFSSRRRHTRWNCDWSSDVCSSDLRERHLALLEREPLAARDANLFFHDVDAGHHLGDRMLDLQPRVRFHEVEASVGIRSEERRVGKECRSRWSRFRENNTISVSDEV